MPQITLESRPHTIRLAPGWALLALQLLLRGSRDPQCELNLVKLLEGGEVRLELSFPQSNCACL